MLTLVVVWSYGGSVIRSVSGLVEAFEGALAAHPTPRNEARLSEGLGCLIALISRIGLLLLVWCFNQLCRAVEALLTLLDDRTLFLKAILIAQAIEEHVEFVLYRVELLLHILFVFLSGVGKLSCQGLEISKLVVLHARLLINGMYLCFQEVELVLNAVLRSIILNLHEILELADLPLPNVLLTCNHLLLHSDDVLAVFELFLKVQNPDEICNHGDLLLCRSLNFEFLNAIKGVTHNRNKQVHENQLDDERAKDEE